MATHLHELWTLFSLLPMLVAFPMYDLLNSFQIMFLSWLSLIQLTLIHKTNVVTFRRCHKIDMDSLCKALDNCSFVRQLGDTVSVLCEQYLSNLSKLLDKHAPFVTHTFTKQATGWLSDSYWLAKMARRQLERMWHKDKSAYNRARLRRQIAWCNSLVSKDKANYFRKPGQRKC